MPLSRGDAARLLRFPQVALVVRGQAEAAGGAGYFRSEVTFRAGGPLITPSRYELTVHTDREKGSRWRRWFGVRATVAVTSEAAGLELQRFRGRRWVGGPLGDLLHALRREKGWLDPMGFLDRRETDVDDVWAHRSGARLVLCAALRRG